MKRITLILLAGALALSLPIAAFAADADSTMKAKPATHHHAKGAKPVAPKVDINSAAKEDLTKLAGITDDLADKIIAGRPYKSRSSLVSKKVLTKAEYSKISAHITAKVEKPAAAK